MQVILGRSQEENEKLLALAAPGDVVFTPDNFRGSTALVAGELDPASEEKIGGLIPAYSQDEVDAWVVRREIIGGESLTFAGRERAGRDAFSALRIGRG